VPNPALVLLEKNKTKNVIKLTNRDVPNPALVLLLQYVVICQNLDHTF
jgi:hypothetical protein